MNEEIKKFQFKNLDEKKSSLNSDLQSYQFKKFNENNPQGMADSKIEKVIKQAKENEFDILPIVKEYKAVKKQKELEKENKIKKEVDIKVLEIEDSAYDKGYGQGLEKGKDEVVQQNKEFLQENLDGLKMMIDQMTRAKEIVFNNQKKEISQLINTLVKWIVLRELKNDGAYVERLLEKLLMELKAKNNIILKVNKDDFAKMEKIMDFIKNNLGELTNVRLEINQTSNLPGIRIESDEGIIDGTLGEQFRKLDKIFESVNINEE
ncbi:MAG: FliH/SctL family protein [Halobacteriovoraceae bacterium]|nr:FliH/SctL family protein [Halobacteriovoraceae bacterium]